MKPVIFIFLFSIAIGITFGSAFAMESSINEEVTSLKSNSPMPYLQAVKMGDVEKIKQLLSDKDYRAYRVLLEQNTAYPDFLRRYYKDVTFHIKDEKNSYFQVEIVFPNGQKEVHKFVMEEGY